MLTEMYPEKKNWNASQICMSSLHRTPGARIQPLSEAKQGMEHVSEMTE